ncbi:MULTISPECIES: glycerophosphodiester phosphodiesterase family protein [Pseudomonas]|uniref:glycerophosphodiester phosphodiesterase family protein n=1 Tax=Pseudomonas nitroreducens TaxID=46680 RepID=UPI001E45BE38|nr:MULTISPECIES: glycerophosphodiester phosphodiesterase family protein [Pseudomonas]MCE4068618.1 glycerophosphodiester phosphodiesterase [Pseudomonas nitritireducens]MCE4077807.1 glycerophosphodiester phosphodiesterase [Pseudomonas nitroreducens]
MKQKWLGAALGLAVLTGCSLDGIRPTLQEPQVVAHRGGTADAPENTLLAIRRALDNHSEGLWLSVQVSADGVAVLYRPADLSALTDAQGAVASKTLEQLRAVNAGYQFKDAAGAYPYRTAPQPIPTLAEALRTIPAQVPLFLDIKARPVADVIDAVARTLDQERAWARVRFYSTERDASDYLAQHYAGRALNFESREATRNRLVDLALGGRCAPPTAGAWMGIELDRELTVTEQFTLGSSSHPVKPARLWTPEAMACVRRAGGTTVMMFGINSAAAYRTARDLGADAVMVDSPASVPDYRRAAAQPGG